MTKIRIFFGIGRKPKKKRERNDKIELPDNFIMGSVNQKTSEEDLSTSDSVDRLQNKKTQR